MRPIFIERWDRSNSQRKRSKTTPPIGGFYVLPVRAAKEPYSIVIYLSEQGCDLSKIEIVSIDINTEVITKARCGTYPNRSLYRLGDEIKERYFIPTKETVIGSSIRFVKK